jgi:hypothetical protein
VAEDVFSEPELDPHTLANLGPLTGMAGIWEGTAGFDAHPVVGGTESDRYVERYELQPIDPQTNGPQYFYGLRYHVHITKPDEVETFHEQVGYWLWNPAESTVTQTVAIPRGQVALASGRVAPDAATWGYDEDTDLQVLGTDAPFHHTDRHVLRKVAEPTPNPLAR